MTRLLIDKAEFHLNRFCLTQPITSTADLITNFENNNQIVVSNKLRPFLKNIGSSYHHLINTFPEIASRLRKCDIILPNSINELERVITKRNTERSDSSIYHLIINPTLDCNVSCWYCYEAHVADSKMTIEVAEAICMNFKKHFLDKSYKMLKLSFFGGEPLLRKATIQYLIAEADKFCKENSLELLIDITTNATLFTTSFLTFLSNFTCRFQITLDGHEAQHNDVKKFKSGLGNPYRLTLKNIHRIQKFIPNSYVCVRINFDANTLLKFDDILNDIDDLDRKKTLVILKKIWQVNHQAVDRELIDNAISSLLENGFLIDYYGQGGWCFADMDNQATINFDGKVFRCTTIDRFDDTTSLGNLELSTGKIKWDADKVKYLANMEISEKCLNCVMLPSCGGPCRKQMSQGLGEKCFLDDQGITKEEFALIHLKINYVKDKIYG
jgi:uncharacterized protein